MRIKCAKYICRIIGCTVLKEKQRLVISEFISGKDVFACVLPACLPKAYDKLRDTTAVVVMPLNLDAIMAR